MNEQIIEQTVKSIVELSQVEFPSVIRSLSALLQDLNKVCIIMHRVLYMHRGGGSGQGRYIHRGSGQDMYVCMTKLIAHTLECRVRSASDLFRRDSPSLLLTVCCIFGHIFLFLFHVRMIHGVGFENSYRQHHEPFNPNLVT